MKLIKKIALGVIAAILSVAVLTGNGMKEVKAEEGDVVSVTVNGSTTNYKTFDEALVAANASKNATIKLLTDLVDIKPVEEMGVWDEGYKLEKDMTIDLDGHKFSSIVGPLLAVSKGVTVTLESENYAMLNRYVAPSVMVSGKLIVNGNIGMMRVTVRDCGSMEMYNGYVHYLYNYGNTTLDGGDVSSEVKNHGILKQKKGYIKSYVKYDGCKYILEGGICGYDPGEYVDDTQYYCSEWNSSVSDYVYYVYKKNMLVFTVSPVSVHQGEDIGMTYTLSGIYQGDSSSTILTKTPTITTDADGSKGGTYAMNISGAVLNEKAFKDGDRYYTKYYIDPEKSYVSANLTIEAHKETDAVKENEVAATSENEGSYDMVTKCSICGATLRIVKHTVPYVDPGITYVTAQTKTIGDAKYEITNTKTPKVEYKGPVDKNVTSVTIPSTVTVDGKTYPVTGICANAFKNCKKLKSVVIGKKVKKIGSKAFYNCKSLKKITIKTKLLKKNTVGSKAFKGINKKAVVKVPKKVKKAYKKFLPKKGITKTMKIK